MGKKAARKKKKKRCSLKLETDRSGQSEPERSLSVPAVSNALILFFHGKISAEHWLTNVPLAYMTIYYLLCGLEIAAIG